MTQKPKRELAEIRLQVLPLFHGTETSQDICAKYGISVKTLRSWWVEAFGKESVTVRGRTLTLKAAAEVCRKAVCSIKVCTICHIEKPLDQFGKRSREFDGHSAQCLSCNNSEKKRWPKDLEKAKASNKRYYNQHREELLEYSSRYRTDHREVIIIKLREYFIRNPAKSLLSNAKQRAKRWDLPFSITVEDILACIPVDGICPIILEPFERGVGGVGPRSMTLDRIIPELGYVPGNIAIISHKANTMKQNCTDPEVFRRVGDYLRGNL
jgi:hypothetical protein